MFQCLLMEAIHAWCRDAGAGYVLVDTTWDVERVLLETLRRQILKRCGGKPFSSSVDLIRKMRAERSRQLDQQ